MKIQVLAALTSAALLSSCSVMPYREEDKISVGAALTGALEGVNEAHRYALAHKLSTYHLKPTRATIQLDLTTMRSSGTNVSLAAALPQGASAGFGWKADRSVEKGSHLVIEFTPSP